jgi:glucoamylase
VFDQISEVVARYRDCETDSKVEFWLPKHPIPQATRGRTIRICAPEPFRLRWTIDNWKTSRDSQSHATGIGGEYFDVGPDGLQSQLDFTFFWPDRGANGGEWEGQNHLVQAR